MSETVKLLCHQCSGELSHLEKGQKIFRSDECPKCYASLHCCKMCFFYDPKVYNECKETSADRVLEKDKNNFCDFFKLKNSSSVEDEKESLKSAADALFKN